MTLTWAEDSDDEDAQSWLLALSFLSDSQQVSVTLHIPGVEGRVPGGEAQIPGGEVPVPGGEAPIPGGEAQIPGGEARIPSSANLCAKEGFAFFNSSRWISSSSFLGLLSPLD